MSTIFIQIKTKFIFFNCCLSKGSLLALLPLPSKPKPSTRPRLRKKRNAPTAFGGLAHPTSSDSTTSAMESGQVWALNKIMKQIFPPGHWPGELAQPWGGKEMRLFQLKKRRWGCWHHREEAWIDFVERRKKNIQRIQVAPDWKVVSSVIIWNHVLLLVLGFRVKLDLSKHWRWELSP